MISISFANTQLEMQLNEAKNSVNLNETLLIVDKPKPSTAAENNPFACSIINKLDEKMVESDKSSAKNDHQESPGAHWVGIDSPSVNIDDSAARIEASDHESPVIMYQNTTAGFGSPKKDQQSGEESDQ